MTNVVDTQQFWNWISRQLADLPDDLSPDEISARLQQRWRHYIIETGAVRRW